MMGVCQSSMPLTLLAACGDVEVTLGEAMEGGVNVEGTSSMIAMKMRLDAQPRGVGVVPHLMMASTRTSVMVLVI
jgi:hypothetical protein